MQIKPILSALRQHKAGTVLIAMQIALTLAIVCNALFIIQQRLAHLSEPSGIDETHLFVVENQWVGKPSPDQLDAQIRADLSALRQLSSVQDASVSNSYPLHGGGWDDGLKLKPDQANATTEAAIYFADEHMLATLGLKLIAGRNFRADEIGHMGIRDALAPPVIVITKALAEKLFPSVDGHANAALGKTVYLMSNRTTIIGIVDQLQSQSVARWAADFAHRSVLVPLRLVSPQGTYYLIQAKPGQLDAAMHAAEPTLLAQSRKRVISDKDGLLSFAEVRAHAYDSDYGMAVLMGIVCVVLLAITAAGIVGLTSFWVGQRRRQIGVRRALGATRRDILSYFMTENLLISSGGALLGVLLAVTMNLWLVIRFEMQHLSLLYVFIGVAILLLLGQCAVLAPAMRAAQVSPVEATRTV
ncbi:ABC transporter permease [Dyella tabacisoli]|uniref:Peptide ABC transporter permease n=1 Tax=Dyella tabacisoli TaxID=2282381 RepID=A0A369UQM2_9GAMM|nr:FtsX-like permease family protein [Dyella tabacisoli]RDD82936.1 peptide ABC transporter permease [Dyella tabacisoli]